jgi:EAL domain-containing protein (putative c-di-GMP-specific phosphodiesterase class I)
VDRVEGSGLEGQPILEFQPAVDLSSGLLLGFEALVRWRHPTRGLIQPAILLPLAEEAGYMHVLSAWVLSEACRQAAGWASGIQIAVNMSAGELREGRASVSTAQALEESGLNPDRLTVEVTERAVADGGTGSDLNALASLGVHLAIDDVGTNWSTLENLRRYSIKTAKIDRSFIAGLEPEEGMNRAIVEAIVHVSHSLAISTVAEGVETAEQVSILRDFGADVGQGYFFAPALPSDVAKDLANTKPRQVFELSAGSEAANEALVHAHAAGV